MKKLLIIILSFISFASYSQVHQQFGAVADNLDSLYTHVGRHHQYVIILGRFNANDGFGGTYIWDSSSTATEVPYTVLKVIGKDTGRWQFVQFLGGGGTDTTILGNPNYAVLNIISTPPTPSSGAKYIVLTPGTGAWAGHNNNIATGTGIGWTFDTATVNQIASNASDNNLYIFTGTAWVALSLNLHQNGENYGNIDIIAGNKQNKGLSLITNNAQRLKIDSIGAWHLSNGTGTNGQVFTSNGNGAEPTWEDGSGGSETWEQTLQNQGSTPFTTSNTVDFGNHDFILNNISQAQINATDGTNSSQILVSPTETVVSQNTTSGNGGLDVVTANDSTISVSLLSQGGSKNHVISVYPDSISADATNGGNLHFKLHKVDSSNANANNIMWMDANDEIHRGHITSGGGTTTNALTMNNSGSGDASGTTFNGGTARTISYNTIGAVPTTRTVNGKALSSDIILGLASADFVNQGTTTTVLHGNAAGNPSFGQIVNADITNSTIDLTTKVTGVLPIANGGTNNGSLSVTNGNLLYTDGSKVVGLGVGTAGQHLVGGTLPHWVDTTATSGGTTSYQSATATGGQTAFTFTSVPATGSDYWIDINGAVVSSSFYSVSTNTITFTTGLIVGDKVGFHRVK